MSHASRKSSVQECADKSVCTLQDSHSHVRRRTQAEINEHHTKNLTKRNNANVVLDTIGLHNV